MKSKLMNLKIKDWTNNTRFIFLYLFGIKKITFLSPHYTQIKCSMKLYIPNFDSFIRIF